MKILGAIIAGGKSSRMGQQKALMLWRGKPLILHIADRLRTQVDQLAVNANEPLLSHLVPVFAAAPVDFVRDRLTLETPLSGLHAALHFARAQGYEAIVSSPCDTPLLPQDLRARLQGQGAAIAYSGGQEHYLTGYWPTSLLAQLEAEIAGGMFRVKDWAAACKARVVEWKGGDPFINVNTPGDFARLP